MTSLEQIIKIRALANDARGDPATRETAQRKLDGLRISHPHLFPAPRPRQKKHPGLYVSEEYERYRFADLNRWRKSAKGNFMTVVTRADDIYLVVLFQRKQQPTYGWQAIDLKTNRTEFSSIHYSTMQDAQMGAWQWLQTI